MHDSKQIILINWLKNLFTVSFQAETTNQICNISIKRFEILNN